MLRALDEMVIEGVHTTIPAHRLVLEHPDFAAGKHSTRWLEEVVDLSGLESSAGTTTAPEDAADEQTVPVEVNGKRFTVKLRLPEGSAAAAAPAKQARAPRPRAAASAASGSDGKVSAPMQGTIVKVLVNVGDTVEPGESLLVLEAMKMENHINAERAGTISEVRVQAGDTVGAGDILIVIE
jgi:acetyl-CoA/propionyl-CoA carboxylase biotin carboxyl carrier protein